MADKIDTSIKLDYSGNISWLSPYIFKSACKIDVTRFPFDSQVCKLEFGSWTYTTESINIVLKEETLDVSQLVKNTEWRVLSGSVKKSDENYPCCTKSYSTITYEVTIERKTLFSLINLILPPLIIVVLSFLTFLLPVECGERISLVMTVLLSMSVFMLYVSGFMPPTSEVVPLIGRFYLACLVVITICLLVTILVVRIHHTMSTIPEWLAVVVNQYLSKVVLMSKPACLAKQGYYEITTDHNHEVPYTKYHNTSSEKNEQVQREEGITQHFIQSCQNDLKTLAAKAKEQKTVKDNCTEWKRIALVFDRLGFIVCLLLFLTFILVIFVK